MSLKTEVYMRQDPKVSIITVVYNGVTHLEQTINSVINQTYNNIEYIIIDGGSTDGTVELIKKYDKHIDYWVSEKDSGIYDAMNKGIAEATGEIVGLINADDWYETDAVAQVIETFVNSNADVVHGSMNIVKENGNSFMKKAELDLSHLKKGMLLNHPTTFIKRGVYESYGSFNTQYKIAADWELVLRLWLEGLSFIAIESALANFRMGGVSSAHLKDSLLEKHQVRKDHDLIKIADWYYLYDRVKSVLPSSLLLEISLQRQKRA